jgi:probable F420-dependent oxidoreductase
MKIGLYAPLAGSRIEAESLALLGSAAEERGFHSLWVPDHTVLFDDSESRYPYTQDGEIPALPEDGFLEPFTTLAFLAAHTRTLRLGTGVVVLPRHNPLQVAKAAATVDRLSEGRLDLGLGVGWLREEFEAQGATFRGRAARTRSYLKVLKRLWCDDVSQYADENYTLPPCRMYPKPVQTPHPPVHFGGQCARALTRVADLAEGWFGLGRRPAEAKQRIAQLEQMLGERGRSRDEVQVSISPYPAPLGPDPADEVLRYRDAGVDQLVLPVHFVGRSSPVAELDDLAAWVSAAR